MATPIRIKRSAVSGKRPQLTDLQVGELALNTYDGSLFTERDTGGVGIATTVSNLTPWTESYGASSISYLNSVGIGTTYPTNRLHITGADPQIKIQDSANGHHAQIFLDGPNSNLNFDWVSSADRKINFINSGTDKGTGSLKVGIGTTNPADSLHIFSNEDGQLRLESADNGAVYQQFYRYNSGVSTRISYFGFGGTGNDISVANEIPGGNILLKTTPSSASAGAEETALQVKEDKSVLVFGNLNISGVSTFSENVNIIRSSGFGALTIQGGEGTNASINLKADDGDDNGDHWQIKSVASDNDFVIANDSSGSLVEKLAIATNGTVSITNKLQISHGSPEINFVDGNNNPDYRILVNGGKFRVQNTSNGNADVIEVLDTGNVVFDNGISVGLDLDVDGHTNLDNVSIAGVTTFTGAIDANGDLDVDGHTNLDNVSIAGVTTMTGNLTVSNTAPRIILNDTDTDSDFRIQVASGNFRIQDVTNGNANRLSINSGGTATFTSNVNIDGNINANGNIVGDNSTNITGIAGVTATTLAGTIQTAAQPNITSLGTLTSLNVSGDVSIGGTLTYEDVTNVDAIGLITARSGIHVVGGGVSIAADGLNVSGVSTLGSGGSGQAILQYQGTTRLKTEPDRIDAFGHFNVGGNVDNALLRLGQSNDLVLYHDGDQSFINNLTSNLNINAPTVVVGTGLSVVGVSTFSDDVNFTSANSNNLLFDKSDNSLKFGDSVRAKFGASTDMEIYHTTASGGTNFIKGTGNLTLQSNVIVLEGQSGDDAIRIDAAGGAVKIYHPGSGEKLRTTAQGIEVSGHAGIGSLTVAGVSTFTGTIDANGNLDVDGHTNLDNVSIAGVTTTTGNLNVTDGSIGVGIATPSQKIHIDGGNLIISNSTQSGSSAPQIRLNTSSSDGSSTRFMLGLASGNNHFINGSSSNDTCFSAPSNILFGIASTRKFRIKTTDVLTDVDFIPSANDATSLGRSNARWSDLFAVDANISGNLNVSGVSTFSDTLKVGTGVTVLTDGNVSIGGTFEIFESSGIANRNFSEFKLSNFSIGQHNNTGTMKIMNNNATGALIIGAGGGGFGGISLFNKNLNAKYLEGNNEGSVDLYHDGDLRFSTTGIGATVYGLLDTTDLNVAGVSTFKNDVTISKEGDPTLTVQTSDLSGEDALIKIRGARTNSTTANIAMLQFDNKTNQNYTMAQISAMDPAGSHTERKGKLVFRTATGGTLSDRMIIDEDGDVEFKHNVGIGTDNPNALLDIGSNSPNFRLTDYNSSAGAGTTSYTQLANINGNTYVYTRANENNGSYLIGGHGNGVFDEFIRIRANGNVGLGTGNPTEKLDIHDSDPRIQLVDTDNNENIQLRNNQGNFILSATKTSIFTGGSQKVLITSGGDVGIGTNNPTGVNALAGNTATLAVGILTANTIYGNVVGGLSPSGNIFIGGNLDVDGHTELDNLNVSGFSTFVGNVRINDNASYTANTNGDNLVIGTTTGSHGITLISGNTGSTNAGSLFFGDTGSPIAGAIRYFHASNYMMFRVAGGEKVRFTGTGRVGIGTISPDSLLHLQGTGGDTSGLRFENSAGNNVGLYLNNDTSSSAFSINYNGTGGGDIQIYHTGDVVVGPASSISNFVGVGTYAPVRKFDVNGDSIFRGNVHVTGIVTASSFVGALPISNDANNRLITASGSGGLNAEGGLTYDGDQYFTFTGSGYKQLTASTTTNNSVSIKLQNQIKNFTITNVAGGLFKISEGSASRMEIQNGLVTFPGNVSIGGTLTYEDVTNVDSIGVITAQNGLNVTSGFSTFASQTHILGSVGIGTDNPILPLHISSTNPGIRLTDENQTTNNKNWHISAGTAQVLRIQAINDAGGGGGQLFDFYRDGNDVEELRGKSGVDYWFTIKNSARRVGIGTINPSESLDIVSATTSQAMRIWSKGSSNSSTLSLRTGDSGNGRILFGDNSDQDIGEIRYVHGDNSMRFITNTDERLHIDSNGRILIGSDTSRATRSGTSNYQGSLQIESDSEAALTMTRFGSTHPSRLSLQHARGTIASIAAAQNNDDIGQISFSAWDGDTFTNAAEIIAEVDGTPGDDDMPGRLIFKTTANNEATTTERLRITSAGQVLINSTGANSYVDGAGFTQTPLLQVKDDGNSNTAISLRYNSGSGSAVRRASFIFARTADGSAVSNNSVLGEVLFMGEGNSTLEKAASIRAEVDGTPGTNDMPGRLIFSTSSDGSDSPTERLRITGIGSVGIGTDDPQQLLHVETLDSTSRIHIERKTGGGVVGLVLKNSNKEYHAQLQGNALQIFDKTATTERLRITTTGDVGIGSAIPAEKLDVAGHIKVDGGPVLETSATYSPGGALRITSPSGFVEVGAQNTSYAHFITNRGRFYFSSRIIVDEGIVGSYNEDLVLATDISEERIRIKNDTGNVGIGTDNPTAKLDVNVGSSVTAFNVSGSEGQLFSVTNNLSSGSIFSVNDISGSPSVDVDADGTIQLAPLLPDEKVGIGTTNPDSKLHVFGNVVVGHGNTFSPSGLGTGAGVGIVTCDVIHLRGGGFVAPRPYNGGSGNKTLVTDASIIAAENFHIYNLESDGMHLRNLIEKNNGIISIGQASTNTITKVRLHPGNLPNGNVELYNNNDVILSTSDTGVVVTGILTATSFVKTGGTSSQFLMADGSTSTGGGGGATDKIEEGNSKVEVVDTGTGSITFVLDGNEKLNMGSYAQFNQLVYVNDTVQVGGQLQVSDAILHMGNSGTRIRFPENDVIELKTDNTVAVRVDQNQNMNVAGIVTATSFVGNGSVKIGTGITMDGGSGIITATQYSGGIYAKFRGPAGNTANINTATGTIMDWMRSDGITMFNKGGFTNTTEYVTVPVDGLYQITLNGRLECSNGFRSNVRFNFSQKLSETSSAEYTESSALNNYIRVATGHNESSVNLTAFIELEAGDQIGVRTKREADAVGTVTLNKLESSITFIKVA